MHQSLAVFAGSDCIVRMLDFFGCNSAEQCRRGLFEDLPCIVKISVVVDCNSVGWFSPSPE